MAVPEMMTFWVGFGLGIWVGTFLGAGVLLFFAGARALDLGDDQESQQQKRVRHLRPHP